MLTIKQLRIISLNYIRTTTDTVPDYSKLIRWTESEDACTLYIYIGFRDEKVVSFYDQTTRRGETTVTDFLDTCRGGKPETTTYKYNF